jgi:hypothetical protein
MAVTVGSRQYSNAYWANMSYAEQEQARAEEAAKRVLYRNPPQAEASWQSFLDGLDARDRIRYDTPIAQAAFFAGLTLGKIGS